MNHILDGYYPDTVIADQLGLTVRTIRRYRREYQDAPAIIRVGKRPLSKLEAWRKFFEDRAVAQNPRRAPAA